jgi:hypothetical protein
VPVKVGSVMIGAAGAVAELSAVWVLHPAAASSGVRTKRDRIDRTFITSACR